jgi:MinD superfamily P-loop ATPase containing an inserted ferredoxin domain
MPYNIMFRHSDPMAKKMWVYAEKMVKHNVKKILSGIEEPPHFGLFQGWYAVPLRIEWSFAITNGRYFRVDYAKCVHCGKCVSSCPLSNVEIKEGKILFGSRCALCMNCSFSCPRKAIIPGLFRHQWLLNGSYNLSQLEKDETIVLPVSSHEKHFNKAYDKYFALIDQATQSD